MKISLKYFSAFHFLFFFIAAFAQQNEKPPQLVVGIVVDQMRYDYMHRFWDKFEEGGFKKLVNGGFFCENTHYNYVPTYTGPGHASIYTGCTPAVHGICANDWFDQKSGKEVNCVFDPGYAAVGTNATVHVSPAMLQSRTIGDELKLATNFRSKVVSISLKDRGAVLPGGHLADAAYWLDGTSGDWISSSYYMKSLPEWVVEVNKEKWCDQYLDRQWETLLPIDQYKESMTDMNPYEHPFMEGVKAVFPYDLPKLKKKLGYGLIKYTPWGNDMVLKMALRTMEEEKLGKNETTDLLLLSFSATDYIGHRFGPRSVEVEDTYLRLDREMAIFLSALETSMGKENVLIFLTSDHGVSDVPSFLRDHRLPGGYYQSEQVKDSLNANLSATFKVNGLVKAFTNQQVYLDHDKISALGRNSVRVVREVITYLEKQPFVRNAVGTREINMADSENHELQLVKKGIFSGRSGDIAVIAHPGWIDSSVEQGTTHGSGYSYDTHVPLIWYGWQVKAGSSMQYVAITDIASTLAGILRLTVPDAASRTPIRLPLK